MQFRLNGVPTRIGPDVSPAETLLRWLRGPACLTGTKEGCAEGDCGACTVAIETPDGGRTPINACLVALGQLDGQSLRTVEGVASHAVPRALAEGNATQCGFCTPGFVMAGWAYAREGGDVHEALAGNLCRCTGYRPIVDALAGLAPDPLDTFAADDLGAATFAGPGTVFHRPRTLDELVALRARHPEAWLLAGGTDLGLLLAEGRDAPAEIIGVGAVPELLTLQQNASGWRIGAGVTYARLLAAFRAEPALAGGVAMLSRLGSRQIRGLGTIGGNLGTASPIGDILPPLLALDAALRLRSLRGARDLAVADFLLGYRQTALAPDEVIESVFLPLPADGAVFACEKISKRYDQDISTVSAAFVLDLDGGRVRRARLAFGGMGPSAARAPRAEAALTGRNWTWETVDAAARTLADDFAPMSDLRATAAYRRDVAAGLLRRLWLQMQQPERAGAYGIPA